MKKRKVKKKISICKSKADMYKYFVCDECGVALYGV